MKASIFGVIELGAFMTAQIAERLLYLGREHAMCTEPLEKYFELVGARPTFEGHCSALWRGYKLVTLK